MQLPLRCHLERPSDVLPLVRHQDVQTLTSAAAGPTLETEPVLHNPVPPGHTVYT